MKHKRKRMRQSVEARLTLNDWEARGQRMLHHQEYGLVEVYASGKIAVHPPQRTMDMIAFIPMHERRGNDFWLVANYVIRKGWA